MAQIGLKRLDTIRAAPLGKVLRGADYQRIVEADAAIATVENDARALFERTRDEALAEAEEQARHATELRSLETSLATVEYLAKLEGNLVQLVTDALRRIVGELAPSDAVVAMIGNLIAQVRAEHQINIRVAPERAAAVNASLGALGEAHPHIKSLEVASDRNLRGTQCRLEMPLGILETSVEELIGTLEQALRQVFTEGGAP